jgi:DNA replication licensing factor MCM7
MNELTVYVQPEQVPIGHVPRLLTVHIRGELTRSCGPGDIVVIDGVSFLLSLNQA